MASSRVFHGGPRRRVYDFGETPPSFNGRGGMITPLSSVSEDQSDYQKRVGEEFMKSPRVSYSRQLMMTSHIGLTEEKEVREEFMASPRACDRGAMMTSCRVYGPRGIPPHRVYGCGGILMMPPSPRVYDDEEDFNEEVVDELIPVEMLSPWDYADEEDYYLQEEVNGLISMEITEPRVSSLFVEGGALQGPVVINDCLLEVLGEGNPENQENEEVSGLVSVEMTPPMVSHSIVDGRASQGEVMLNDCLLDLSNDVALEEENLENQMMIMNTKKNY